MVGHFRKLGTLHLGKGHLERLLVDKVPHARVARPIHPRVECKDPTCPSCENRPRNGLVDRRTSVIRIHIDAHVERIQHAVSEAVQVGVLVRQGSTLTGRRVQAVVHDDAMFVARRGRQKNRLISVARL